MRRIKIALSSTPYEFNVEVPPDAPTPEPHFVKVADMNLDGHQDLVVTCFKSNRLSVLLNDLFVPYGPQPGD